MPQIQLLHLTGPNDVQKVETAYASNKVPAVVKSFFGEMHLALGAATVAVSRAGASSLAELAAMRVPSVLVPYPAATDNHQFYNAQALEKSGAALMAQQGSADPDWLGRTVVELAQPGTARSHMQDCLAAWHAPRAADQIAEIIVQAIVARRRATGRPVSRVSADVQRHQSVVT
jgi:UDP-N-acetylglucosamine--N-acetylmuramyl-(pentapeptide) pyrophosphoryl-undecaprenol N-acetylglucosamine transferase